MSGRSARVGALSDKIQGLKFMQRAANATASSSSASKTIDADEAHAATLARHGVKPKKKEAASSLEGFPDQSGGPSTQRAPRKDETVREASQERIETHDANEEHWVLPSARHASTASIPGSANIVVEPGWHTWLGQLASDQEESAHKRTASRGRDVDGSEDEDGAETVPTLTARRAFGGWGASGKRKKREKEDATEETADRQDKRSKRKGQHNDPPEEGAKSGQGSKKAEKAKLLPAGEFVKPGSLTSDGVITSARKPSKAKAKREQGDALASTSTTISASAARKQQSKDSNHKSTKGRKA